MNYVTLLKRDLLFEFPVYIILVDGKYQFKLGSKGAQIVNEHLSVYLTLSEDLNQGVAKVALLINLDLNYSVSAWLYALSDVLDILFKGLPNLSTEWLSRLLKERHLSEGATRPAKNQALIKIKHLMDDFPVGVVWLIQRDYIH